LKVQGQRFVLNIVLSNILIQQTDNNIQESLAKCQSNPNEQDFLQPNSPVKIISGKYKLKTGKVVKLTPKKVRISLDSEKGEIYIDQKNCVLIVTPK
jgi:transcription antitermination factor NusG